MLSFAQSLHAIMYLCNAVCVVLKYLFRRVILVSVLVAL